MIMIMIKLWNLKVDDAETEDFKLLPNYIIASTTDCMQKEIHHSKEDIFCSWKNDKPKIGTLMAVYVFL